jgi:hypothetical protein
MSLFTKVFTLTFCLLISALALGQNNACIVQQAWGPDRFELRSGTIAQTFTPCSEGELNYIELQIGSLNSTSFATRLKISKFTRSGQEQLSTQQIVVPSSNQDPIVRIWLASPVQLQENDTYLFTITAHNEHPIAVHYSSENDYPFGSILKNGQRERGDLAFELGIKHEQPELAHKTMFKISPSTDPCALKNTRDDEQRSAQKGIWQQTIRPCNTTNLSSIAVLAACSQDELGTLSISLENGSGYWEVLHQQEILLGAGHKNWKEMFLNTTVELMSSQSYLISLELNDPWGTSFYGTRSNPVKSGRAYGQAHMKIADWAFKINSSSYSLPEYTESDGDCSMTNAISPMTRSSTNELVAISFIACEFGSLNSIQIPLILREGNRLSWFIRDKQEYLLSEGELNSGDIVNGIAKISPENLQLVEGLEYDLLLITEDIEAVKFYYARPDAVEIEEISSDLDESILPLALKIDIKSEVLEFIEAEDEALIKSSIYPNPFDEQFNLKLEGNYTGSLMIGVYDFRGNEVHSERLETTAGSSTHQININQNLLPGYYTLRIECGNEVYLETLVKR